MRPTLLLAFLYLLTLPALAQESDSVLIAKYDNIADSLGKISDFKNAILYKKRTLNILQRQNPVPYAKLASTHRGIGFYYRKWGKFGESKSFQLKAVKLAEENLPPDHVELAKAYNSLGSYYFALGKYDLCYRWFIRALEIGISGEHDRTGDYYNNVGIAQQHLGQKTEALATYQTALDYNRKKFGLWNAKVADNFTNIGTLYNDLGNLQMSIIYLDSAEMVQDSVLSPDAPEFALLYNNLGAVYTSKGDHRQALRYLEDGLDLYKKHLGDSHPEVASIYVNIGLLLLDQGDVDKALTYFKKTYSIREKHFGLQSPFVAKACVYLGNTYLAKRYYEEAHDWLKKGVDIFSSLPASDPGDLADAKNDLGLYFEQVGNYREALRQYEGALKINARKINRNDPDVANSYARIGKVHLAKTEFETASSWFQKALDIRLQAYGETHADVAETYRLLALSCPDDVACSSEYIDLAFHSISYLPGESEFDEALSPISLLKIFQAQSEILHGLFEFEQNEEFLLAADKVGKRSIELIEFIKTSLEQPGSRLALQDNFYLIYENAIDVKFKLESETGNQKYWNEAFKIAEQSNAILLMEALQSVDAERFAGIPEKMLELEHQLKVDLAYFEKLRFEEELKSGGGDPKIIAKLNNRIFNIHNSYHDLLTYFRKNHKEYFEMKYAPEVVTVEKIQSELLRPDQTMLSYFVGERNVFAFIISQNGFEVVRIRKEFPLEIWVEEFRSSIARFNPAVKELEYLNQKYANIGHELYQLLFEPVRDELKTESLVIIPGGMLGYLPFDALLATPTEDYSDFDNHDYLIRHFQISYSYSASLLQQMMEGEHRSKPFVAFAPSYFGDTLNVSRSNDPWQAVLGQLRFNEWEAREIHKLMGGEIYLDGDATEEKFLERASDAGILHLATHGKSNDRHGEYSYLAFFQLQDSIENELLFVKNLYNLSIPASLVVLSACETGIGELQRGEGIVSLSRGFSYAGAASILTTMWNIDDQASANIMVDFYRKLKKGQTKDEALRNAKLTYLKNMAGSNRSHPLFWAAYVPVGDMSPLDGEGMPWWGWALIGLAGVAVLRWVFFT